MYGAAPRFRTRPPPTTHPDTPPAAKPAQASTGANFSLLLQLHEAVGGKVGWGIVRAACIDTVSGHIDAAACLAFFNSVQPLFDAAVRVLAVGLTSDDEELSENAHYMLLYNIVSPAGYWYNATVAEDATAHPVDLGEGAVDRIKSKIEGLVHGPDALSRCDLHDFVSPFVRALSQRICCKLHVWRCAPVPHPPASDHAPRHSARRQTRAGLNRRQLLSSPAAARGCWRQGRLAHSARRMH